MVVIGREIVRDHRPFRRVDRVYIARPAPVFRNTWFEHHPVVIGKDGSGGFEYLERPAFEISEFKTGFPGSM
jgi:hypothetical protein